MRATTFNGQEQSMVLPDGTPKGMRLVLEERRVNTKEMTANKLREVLSKHEDLKKPKTMLEEKVEARGHMFVFSEVSLRT